MASSTEAEEAEQAEQQKAYCLAMLPLAWNGQRTTLFSPAVAIPSAAVPKDAEKFVSQGKEVFKLYAPLGWQLPGKKSNLYLPIKAGHERYRLSAQSGHGRFWHPYI